METALTDPAAPGVSSPAGQETRDPLERITAGFQFYLRLREVPGIRAEHEADGLAQRLLTQIGREVAAACEPARIDAVLDCLRPLLDAIVPVRLAHSLNMQYVRLLHHPAIRPQTLAREVSHNAAGEGPHGWLRAGNRLALWVALNNPACPPQTVLALCLHRSHDVRSIVVHTAGCTEEGKTLSALAGGHSDLCPPRDCSISLYPPQAKHTAAKD